MRSMSILSINLLLKPVCNYSTGFLTRARNSFMLGRFLTVLTEYIPGSFDDAALCATAI